MGALISAFLNLFVIHEYNESSSIEDNYAHYSRTTELGATLRDLDAKLDGDEKSIRKALEKLRDLIVDYPAHNGIYWRFIKACNRLTELITDPTDTGKLVDEVIIKPLH